MNKNTNWRFSHQIFRKSYPMKNKRNFQIFYPFTQIFFSYYSGFVCVQIIFELKIQVFHFTPIYNHSWTFKLLQHIKKCNLFFYDYVKEKKKRKEAKTRRQRCNLCLCGLLLQTLTAVRGRARTISPREEEIYQCGEILKWRMSISVEVETIGAAIREVVCIAYTWEVYHSEQRNKILPT